MFTTIDKIITQANDKNILIGELDVSKFDRITKQFVNTSIIKYTLFHFIWKFCSRNLTIPSTQALNRIKVEDLKIFRTALKLGIIQSQIDR